MKRSNEINQPLSNKFFKTIEQMSTISGIGENTLRQLVEDGEIDYITIGNRKLIADSAIWSWYEKAKTKGMPIMETSNVSSIQQDKSLDRQKRARHKYDYSR